MPAFDSRRRFMTGMFSRMVSEVNRPCVRRSSGTSAMPEAMAPFGEFPTGRPLKVTEPAKRSTPNSARAISVFPAPTSP